LKWGAALKQLQDALAQTASLTPASCEGERWFVVCARPHGEKRAHAHLKNQDFGCFLPLHSKTVRHARQFRSVLAPLFPRYLFVKLDLARDRWRSILGTQGVSNLIMEGERPKPVRPGVVEALSAAADQAGLIGRPPELRIGAAVRLQTGPLAGLVGELLTLDDNGRVSVLMSLLGSPTIVRSTRLGLVPAA
jgi:transcription elongation factor/antiterminator RfaH